MNFFRYGNELAKLERITLESIQETLRQIEETKGKPFNPRSNIHALIEQIVGIFDNYGFETEILAASIRHNMHLIQCAEIGADVATCPLSVITGLLKHPLTDSGLEKFLADYQKGNK